MKHKTKTYTISADNHYSNNWFGRIFNIRFDINQINLTAMFDKNCWYDRSQVNQTGLNKLYGFSYGLFGIHKRSVRIAWQPDFTNPDLINIYAYYHDDSNRDGYIKKPLVSVYTQQWFEINFLNIQHYPKIVCKYANKKIASDYVFKSKTRKFLYMLYPYFGGKSKAPHRMDITLDLVIN